MPRQAGTPPTRRRRPGAAPGPAARSPTWRHRARSCTARLPRHTPPAVLLPLKLRIPWPSGSHTTSPCWTELVRRQAVVEMQSNRTICKLLPISMYKTH